MKLFKSNVYYNYVFVWQTLRTFPGSYCRPALNLFTLYARNWAVFCSDSQLVRHMSMENLSAMHIMYLNIVKTCLTRSSCLLWDFKTTLQ